MDKILTCCAAENCSARFSDHFLHHQVEVLLMCYFPGANLPEKARTFSMGKESVRQASLKGRSNQGTLLSGCGKVAAWLLDSEGIHQCNKGM